MPRTAITVQELPRYGASLDDLVFTAADAANDHEFENSGREIVLFKNDDAGPHTATLEAPATDRNFNDPISVPLIAAASEISIAGPLDPAVFNQSGTKLAHLDLANDTSQFVAVVRFIPIR